MGTAISISALFVLLAIVLRHVIIKKPLKKINASWISFGLAIVATTICTLIAGGEQQSTLITGFATMLFVYNILCR